MEARGPADEAAEIGVKFTPGETKAKFIGRIVLGWANHNKAVEDAEKNPGK